LKPSRSLGQSSDHSTLQLFVHPLAICPKHFMNLAFLILALASAKSKMTLAKVVSRLALAANGFTKLDLLLI
jgi:hypothetical protein